MPIDEREAFIGADLLAEEPADMQRAMSDAEVIRQAVDKHLREKAREKAVGRRGV